MKAKRPVNPVEIPNIIVKCVRSYQEVFVSHKGVNFYGYAPSYFLETQMAYRTRHNLIWKFLRSRVVQEDKQTGDKITYAFRRCSGHHVEAPWFAEVYTTYRGTRSKASSNCPILSGTGKDRPIWHTLGFAFKEENVLRSCPDGVCTPKNKAAAHGRSKPFCIKGLQRIEVSREKIIGGSSVS
jgi:hypothetical protein